MIPRAPHGWRSHPGGRNDRQRCPIHHANIDRLWAQWQTAHPKAKTPHSTTVLQPSPLLGVKVATQLDIATLGYNYA